MTHDELVAIFDLATIRDPIAFLIYKALRAVVELHHSASTGAKGFCTECAVSYPCPTIRVIAEELK